MDDSVDMGEEKTARALILLAAVACLGFSRARNWK